MTDFPNISVVFFSGVGGVIIGIFLTEIIRRLNRIEQFNNQIFNRRLEEYIALYDLLLEQDQKANYMFDNIESLDAEEKQAIVSSIVLPIAKFNDANALFISEELALQTTSLYMGIESYEAEELELRRMVLNKQFRDTVQMIKAESGIEKVNNNFQKVFKFNHKSPIISDSRKMRKSIKKAELKHSFKKYWSRFKNWF